MPPPPSTRQMFCALGVALPAAHKHACMNVDWCSQHADVTTDALTDAMSDVRCPMSECPMSRPMRGFLVQVLGPLGGAPGRGRGVRQLRHCFGPVLPPFHARRRPTRTMRHALISDHADGATPSWIAAMHVCTHMAQRHTQSLPCLYPMRGSRGVSCSVAVGYAPLTGACNPKSDQWFLFLPPPFRTAEFPYMSYAKNRIGEFYKTEAMRAAASAKNI